MQKKWCFVALHTAAENDVSNQSHLSCPATFNLLRPVLSDVRLLESSSRDSVLHNAVLFFTSLTLNNGSGQNLSRETGCLHILSDLYQKSFPAFLVPNLSLNSNGGTLLHLILWEGVNVALICAINNPKNEENQEVCGLLLPFCFQVLQYSRDSFVNATIGNLVANILVNNERNQNTMIVTGGLRSITSSLKKTVSYMERQSSGNQLDSALLSILIAYNAAIADHAQNANFGFKLGVFDDLFKVLKNENTITSAKAASLHVLSGSAEVSEECRSYLTNLDWLSSLIKKLVETIDYSDIRLACAYLLCLVTNKVTISNGQNLNTRAETIPDAEFTPDNPTDFRSDIPSDQRRTNNNDARQRIKVARTGRVFVRSSTSTVYGENERKSLVSSFKSREDTDSNPEPQSAYQDQLNKYVGSVSDGFKFTPNFTFCYPNKFTFDEFNLNESRLSNRDENDARDRSFANVPLQPFPRLNYQNAASTSRWELAKSLSTSTIPALAQSATGTSRWKLAKPLPTSSVPAQVQNAASTSRWDLATTPNTVTALASSNSTDGDQGNLTSVEALKSNIVLPDCLQTLIQRNERALSDAGNILQEINHENSLAPNLFKTETSKPSNAHLNASSILCSEISDERHLFDFPTMSPSWFKTTEANGSPASSKGFIPPQLQSPVTESVYPIGTKNVEKQTISITNAATASRECLELAPYDDNEEAPQTRDRNTERKSIEINVTKTRAEKANEKFKKDGTTLQNEDVAVNKFKGEDAAAQGLIDEDTNKKRKKEEAPKQRLIEEREEKAAAQRGTDARSTKKLEEEALAQRLVEDVAAQRLVEEEAIKKREDEAAAQSRIEKETAKKREDEAAAESRIEKETAKKREENTSAQRLVEEVAAQRRIKEEATKKREDEAAAQSRIEKGTAKKREEYTSAQRLVEEVAAQRRIEEEATKKRIEEETTKKREDEAAAESRIEKETAKKREEDTSVQRRIDAEATEKRNEEGETLEPKEDSEAQRSIDDDATENHNEEKAMSERPIIEKFNKKRVVDAQRGIEDSEEEVRDKWKYEETTRKSFYKESTRNHTNKCASEKNKGKVAPLTEYNVALFHKSMISALNGRFQNSRGEYKLDDEPVELNYIRKPRTHEKTSQNKTNCLKESKAEAEDNDGNFKRPTSIFKKCHQNMSRALSEQCENKLSCNNQDQSISFVVPKHPYPTTSTPKHSQSTSQSQQKKDTAFVHTDCLQRRKKLHQNNSTLGPKSSKMSDIFVDVVVLSDDNSEWHNDGKEDRPLVYQDVNCLQRKRKCQKNVFKRGSKARKMTQMGDTFVDVVGLSEDHSEGDADGLPEDHGLISKDYGCSPNISSRPIFAEQLRARDTSVYYSMDGNQTNLCAACNTAEALGVPVITSQNLKELLRAHSCKYHYDLMELEERFYGWYHETRKKYDEGDSKCTNNCQLIYNV